jgi:hypothetical protein
MFNIEQICPARAPIFTLALHGRSVMLRFVLLDRSYRSCRSSRSYDPETVAVMGAAFDRVCLEADERQRRCQEDAGADNPPTRRPGRARRRATRGDCLPRMDGHRPFGNPRPLGQRPIVRSAI